MKKQSMQDERVLALRHKISNEVCGILMIVLLVSILVQQFLLNAPFEQYAAESICLFGISVYTVVRYIMLGINISGEGKLSKSLPWVICMVAGITVTAINGVLNYAKYAENYKEDGIGLFIAMLAVTFISASFSTFIILSFFNYLNYKKQAKIHKHMDKED